MALQHLHRSELCVPASSVHMLEKSTAASADYVMLDLEDAVAPDDKPQARANAIDALHELDWGATSVSLRINGLDTPYCYRDRVDVVAQAGDRLDTIMVPKVSCAADVHLVTTLLTQIEDACGLRRRLGIAVLVETAAGMHRVDEIVAACPERMEAVVFDAASLRQAERLLAKVEAIEARCLEPVVASAVTSDRLRDGEGRQVQQL